MNYPSRHRSGKAIVKIAITFLIVTAIIGYSYYQARNLINGPQISLESPTNGATLANPLVAIKGIAKNVSYISLNNRQIFVDESGTFNEELLLSPGYNMWEIQAKDKFGRVVSKKIELVFSKS